MNRRSLVLAGLAPAAGGQHSPAQLQKLFFLIDRNLADLTGGPHFNFSPYDYGPFDKAVYNELEALQRVGLAEIDLGQRWRTYRLTREGQKQASAAFSSLPTEAQRYLKEVSEFVRSVSFTELVSSIYRAYPEMRANSVFRE